MEEKVSKILQKYNSDYTEKQKQKKIISSCVEEVSKISIDIKDIEINKNWIILHISSVLKKEVMLYERKILQKIELGGYMMSKIK